MNVSAPEKLEFRQSSSREQSRGLPSYVGVFALGTAIRLVILFLVRSVPFTSDAQDYADAATRLLSGDHLVPYWPPGLPLYLAVWLRSGAGEVGLRASMLLFWMILAWGLWRAARELDVTYWAWLLLLAVAVMPASIHLSIETLTQQPVAACFLLALGCGVASVRRGLWRDIALLGVALGWMALIRPSSIPVLFAVPVICCAAALRRRREWWPRFGVSLALASVMVVCWMVRAHAISGAWIINSSNGLNFYDGNNPWTPLYKTWYFGSHAKLGSKEIKSYPEFEAILERVERLPAVQASAEFQRLATEEIRLHPIIFLLRTTNRIRCFFGFPTFTALNLRSSGNLGKRLFFPCMAVEACVYLALIGTALFWIAAAPSHFWEDWVPGLLAIAIVLYAVPYWLSMSHPSYNFPVVLPIALLGAMAHRLARADRSIAWRGWFAVGLLMAVQVEWVLQSWGP